MIRSLLGKKFPVSRLALTFGLGSSLLALGTATAQQVSNPTTSQAPETAEADRVIVTGSNIPTSEEVGEAPVDTVDQAARDRTGQEDVLQVLTRANPAISSGGGNLGSSNASIGSGDTLGGSHGVHSRPADPRAPRWPSPDGLLGGSGGRRCLHGRESLPLRAGQAHRSPQGRCVGHLRHGSGRRRGQRHPRPGVPGLRLLRPATASPRRATSRTSVTAASSASATTRRTSSSARNTSSRTRSSTASATSRRPSFGTTTVSPGVDASSHGGGVYYAAMPGAEQPERCGGRRSVPLPRQRRLAGQRASRRARSRQRVVLRSRRRQGFNLANARTSRWTRTAQRVRLGGPPVDRQPRGGFRGLPVREQLQPELPQRPAAVQQHGRQVIPPARRSIRSQRDDQRRDRRNAPPVWQQPLHSRLPRVFRNDANFYRVVAGFKGEIIKNYNYEVALNTSRDEFTFQESRTWSSLRT